MSTLTGQKIANSYKNLLQVSNNNSGVDGTLRSVEDGEGTNTPLQLSNAAVNINGPSAFQLNGVTLTATASVLNAVADLTGANGMVAVSGGQVYGRTLTGSTGITITNANGTEGNPTFAVASSIATSADISALETSIANSNSNIAAVSVLTSVNKAAITSINTVINNLDYATSAELAAVSALTSVNKAAITSINTVIDNLDYATSAELAAVSSTLATSIATRLPLSGGTLTGQLIGTSAIFSGAVCATTFYGNGSNLTGITASVPASVATSAQLAAVSSRITSVSDFAVNLSATFATSINNSNITIAAVSALTSVNKAAITSINTVVANVSALTSVNKAAITSINTVIDNLDYATSAELAAVSALTSVNKAAITSINTVIDNLDYATSAELAAVSALTSVNKAAITSINTVIDNLDYATSAELAAVSSTLATSINNSNITIAAVSALTSVNKSAITSINTVIDNLDYATSAELAGVSSTLATSINNSNITIAAVSALTSVNKDAITSINTVVANVSALTSVNKAAITSINTVIDNLDFATSAELAGVSSTLATSINNSNITIAAVSALTSVNKAAITSINTVVANVSALTSVNKAAITSINTVIDNLDYATSAELAGVSSTLATSISNHLRLSGGTLTGQLIGTSATFSGAVCATTFYGDGSNLTGITASVPTSVLTYTVNQLTVVSNATFSGPVSGTSAIFTGIVSANEFDALIGSFSTSVSIGANLNVTGAVSGTSGIFTGTVSVNEIDASIGSFNGAVSVGGAINIVGAVSGTSAIFTGAVSVSTGFDSKGELRTIPKNSQTTAYTLQASDSGKVVAITSGGITVPQNVFLAGNAISIYNDSASNQTITQGTSVTMYLVGTATTGNRTLAQRGLATVLCLSSVTFVISGGGLT